MSNTVEWPLVSIIICVYNGEKYLDNALESVYAQDYQPIELICVDDGSTDNSASILKRDSYRLSYIRQEHLGLVSARNTGIEKTKGEFVCFLDSDDLFTSNRLSMMVSAITKDSSIDLVYGMVTEFTENPTVSPEKSVTRTLPGICPGGILIRRTLFDSCGYFKEVGQTAYFLDWYFRLQEYEAKTLQLDEVVTMRRIHNENLGLRLRNTLSSETARVIKAHLDRIRKND